MSVISMRCLNTFYRIIKIPSEISYVQKLCIHCSTTHNQEKGSVLSIENKPKTSVKEERISKAMKSYLEKRKKADEVMQGHVQEYEMGKRHLANIMGKDPDDFTQKDIDEAISYLLPSGLFNKKARPLLKHPFEILPKLISARFDVMGRPKHFLFYTVKQSYYELMHDIAWKIEDLKGEEDELTKQPFYDFRSDDPGKIDLLGSTWINQAELEKKLNEKITEHDYKRFVVIMEQLANQPLSGKEQEFIMSYRRELRPMSVTLAFQKPLVDEEGRQYSTGKGKRKSSVAEVTVYGNGRGEITINGRDISYFSELIHREQVIFPLQFSGTLGTVDFVAHVTEGGPTGQSGAIRVALARALTAFVSKDMIEKMRLAGLLTTDPRKRERKKPGQEGARKKFTWKKR